MVNEGNSQAVQREQSILAGQRQAALQYAIFNAKQVSGAGMSPQDYNTARANAYARGLAESGATPFSDPSHIAGAQALGIDLKGYTGDTGPPPSAGRNIAVGVSENIALGEEKAQDQQRTTSETLGISDKVQAKVTRGQDKGVSSYIGGFQPTKGPSQQTPSRPLLLSTDNIPDKPTLKGKTSGYADYFGATPSKNQTKSVLPSDVPVEGIGSFFIPSASATSGNNISTDKGLVTIYTNLGSNGEVKVPSAPQQEEYLYPGVKGFSSGVISNAKNYGANYITIFDETGKQIDNIPIKSADRVLPLAIQSYSSLGKQVKVGFTPIGENLTSKPTGKVTSDLFLTPDQKRGYSTTPLGFGLSLPIPTAITEGIQGAKAEAKNLTSQFTELPRGIYDIFTGKLTSQGPLGIPAPAPPETNPSPFGNILSGRNPSTGKGTAYDVGSLLFDVGLIASPIKGAKGASGFSDLFTSSKTATQIAKGLREGELPFQVSKRPQTSRLFTFEQGTEGRSSTPSSSISELFGIGRKGEKVSLTNIPKEVKIPSAQGEAENPLAFIKTTGEGATAIVRKETIPYAIPQRVLIKGKVNPAVASRLGLIKVQGAQDLFFGPTTTETRLALRQAENVGQLNPVTDILSFPTSEVKNAPSQFAFFSRNPEALFTNQFPEFTRPTVTRFYETRNLGFENPTATTQGQVTAESFLEKGYEGEKVGSKGLKRKLLDVGLSAAEEPKQTRPPSPINDIFGFGSIEPKTGAGGEGKARALTEEQKGTLKEYYGLTSKQTTKQRYDYLGPVLTPEERRQQQRNVSVTTEYEYLFGPPEQINRSISITKPNLIERTNIFFQPDVKPKQKIKEITTPIFGTTPKVKTKTITTPITVPRQGIVPILTPITTPKTTPKTTPITTPALVPQLLLTPPPIPPPPPKIKIPEPEPFFPFVPFGGLGGEGKKKRGNKSYILYGTNPLAVGEFYTPGLAEQTVSSSPSIFLKGEKIIRKANRGRVESGYFSFSTPKPISKSKKGKSKSNKQPQSTNLFF